MPKDLPLHNLRDVLGGLPMPEGYGPAAPGWRCRLAPEVGTEQEMLEYFHQGIPCFLPVANSRPVHDVCEDGIDFITNPQWDKFPRPKIAFLKGWAGPGTEMESEAMHRLVASFGEVLDAPPRASATPPTAGAAPTTNAPPPSASCEPSERPAAVEEGPISAPVGGATPASPEILNLQLFHRKDAATHPQLPVLAERLVWPKFAAAGAVCDNATRVSRRGAITWWHLDDAGEFVMQTALANKKHKAGVHPVKLFIYGPKSSYDWFMHDSATDERGKIVGLNIYDAPGKHLPPPQFLPIVTVAVLKAGGRPLVSPPNIPHCVLTLNDCVMVEQRRILDLFLDECAYLLQRARHWQAAPIIYRYLNRDLRAAACVEAVVARLERLLVPSSADAVVFGGGTDAAQSALRELVTRQSRAAAGCRGTRGAEGAQPQPQTSVVEDDYEVGLGVNIDPVIEAVVRQSGAAGTALFDRRIVTSLLTLGNFPRYFPLVDGAYDPPVETQVAAAPTADGESEAHGVIGDAGAAAAHRRPQKPDHAAQSLAAASAATATRGAGDAPGQAQRPRPKTAAELAAQQKAQARDTLLRTHLAERCALRGADERLLGALERYWDAAAAWPRSDVFALDAHLRTHPAALTDAPPMTDEELAELGAAAGALRGGAVVDTDDLPEAAPLDPPPTGAPMYSGVAYFRCQPVYGAPRTSVKAAAADAAAMRRAVGGDGDDGLREAELDAVLGAGRVARDSRPAAAPVVAAAAEPATAAAGSPGGPGSAAPAADADLLDELF